MQYAYARAAWVPFWSISVPGRVRKFCATEGRILRCRPNTGIRFPGEHTHSGLYSKNNHDQLTSLKRGYLRNFNNMANNFDFLCRLIGPQH